MKTDALAVFKRKYWAKIGVCLAIMIVGYYFLYLLFSRLTHQDDLDPLTYFILYLIVGSGLLLLARAFLSSMSRTTKDYEEAEKKFEETGNALILEAFGAEDFDRLYTNDLNLSSSAGIDICQKMLNSEKTGAGSSLQFHLYAKIAKYYARDKQPKEAVANLLKALLIKPANLIVNYRIATLYESLGAGQDAISHYEGAQRDAGISSGIKEYLTSQIQRIKTNGPRLKGPWDDSGFQWITS
jgi:tetratricopeptide (TPR) repeat protein